MVSLSLVGNFLGLRPELGTGRASRALLRRSLMNSFLDSFPNGLFKVVLKGDLRVLLNVSLRVSFRGSAFEGVVNP